MSKPCPIFGRAIYADCLDCDDKYCRSINHNIKLHKGDIFYVDLNTFMSTSALWCAPYQILKFDKYKRKWWKIWKPKWTYFAQIEFLG